LSLPERAVRAAATGLGGLLYEATQVVLPGWLRRSRLHRSFVVGTLRNAIELAGGATAILPPDDITPQQLAVQTAVGTGVEMARLPALTWSPL
jgi:hypothetical protein